MVASLVDIGVNLTNKAYRTDRDAVIERAICAGVERMVVTGTSAHGSEAARKLAATRPGTLFATAGVHPHDAKSCDDTTIATLRCLAQEPEVVAIGECGLDFNRDFSPRPVQRRWFEAQVELACDLAMPLFLHERDALDAQVEILARYRHRFPRAVIHCFTGTQDALRAYIELDMYIGITGWICDERRGKHLLDLVQTIPRNRLLIETDAPYLTPRTMRPKPKKGRNEPAFLPHVAQAVAQCLDMPVDDIATLTTNNAVSFFGLAPAAHE